MGARKPRIKSSQPLYQYVFDENGGMKFDVCYIVRMKPKQDLGRDGNWIYHPENNKITYKREQDHLTAFYVYEEDVDTRFSSFGKYKTLVLSVQDDELALDIYIETLMKRIEDLEGQIRSFREQIGEARERMAGWSTMI